MAAEELILVDAFDRELGVGEKMEVHRAGALHRAFSVFVFDDRGRLLMQKRAADKYHSAGLWANMARGHPRPRAPPPARAGRAAPPRAAAAARGDGLRVRAAPGLPVPLPRGAGGRAR